MWPPTSGTQVTPPILDYRMDAAVHRSVVETDQPHLTRVNIYSMGEVQFRILQHVMARYKPGSTLRVFMAVLAKASPDEFGASGRLLARLSLAELQKAACVSRTRCTAATAELARAGLVKKASGTGRTASELEVPQELIDLALSDVRCDNLRVPKFGHPGCPKTGTQGARKMAEKCPKTGTLKNDTLDSFVVVKKDNNNRACEEPSLTPVRVTQPGLFEPAPILSLLESEGLEESRASALLAEHGEEAIRQALAAVDQWELAQVKKGEQLENRLGAVLTAIAKRWKPAGKAKTAQRRKTPQNRSQPAPSPRQVLSALPRQHLQALVDLAIESQALPATRKLFAEHRAAPLKLPLLVEAMWECYQSAQPDRSTDSA